ncbi:hypothetical protein GCK32_014259 [Trichostrongylus colubriformis]|uniref:Uncharacterized protein n=1 Tax=Trichostrongylus colubriformis TaxID=6319 RepID=A0AAN8FHY4_TRICO
MLVLPMLYIRYALKSSFCSPDAPVNRVTVTSDLVLPESPSPISPPNQIEEIRRVTISPPLHSKKMAEHENPFRPEEVLYHEVDPIVEQYMHKPFPPSRPGSAENTPVKQQKDGSLSSPVYLQNGLSKEQLMDNEKAQSQPLLSSDQRQSSPEKRYNMALWVAHLSPRLFFLGSRKLRVLWRKCPAK